MSIELEPLDAYRVYIVALSKYYLFHPQKHVKDIGGNFADITVIGAFLGLIVNVEYGMLKLVLKRGMFMKGNIKTGCDPMEEILEIFLGCGIDAEFCHRKMYVLDLAYYNGFLYYYMIEGI
jgi:hypothetical protein